MRTLVGDDHRRLVEMLIGRVDALRDGDVEAPRIVILEGASGLGKSRVVREVYRELRSRYDPEGYWPELDESGGSEARSRDPLPARKCIGPDVECFLWPAGALPGFAWWQLQCERMQGGDLVDVAGQIRAQIAAHLVPVALAWREAATMREKAAAKKADMATAAREAFLEGGLEAASRALATFDVVIPGLGLAASWAMRGVADAKERFHEWRDTRAEIDLGRRAKEQRRSVSIELAGLLRGVAHRDVPAIVVIEDLHLMGDALAELLALLSSADATHPVLVVGTAWPQSGVLSPYTQWLGSAATNHRAQIERMPYLQPTDLTRFIRAYAPSTSDDVAAQAVNRYPNPLSLEVLLSLRQVRDDITAHDGALPPSALSSRSPKLKGLYRDQFWELPDQIQIALSAAAAAVPRSSTRVWPFVRGVVAEAAQRCPDLPADASAILLGVEHAAEDKVWLVRNGVADSFREALQAQIALEHFEESISDQEPVALQEAVADVLMGLVDKWRSDGYLLDNTEEVSIACRWLLELRPLDHTGTALAAATHVATNLAHTYQFTEAIETLAPRLDHVSSNHTDVLSIRHNLALWMNASGRPAEALAAFENLLIDRLNVLGPDHPNTLATRASIATCLGEAGRTVESIVAFEHLLADRVRVLGEYHPRTLEARASLANQLGQAGRVSEAITAFEQVLADQVRVLGADHPSTLRTRGRIVAYLGQAGRTAEALAAGETLLRDDVRVLGADHENTLAARHTVASLLREAGRVAEAIDAYKQLLPDLSRVLGPDHPDYLTACENYAGTLGVVGRTAESLTAFEQLLAHKVRILGPHHPGTLITRGNYAYFLGESGHTAEAVTAMEQLLPDKLRVFGGDHPTTLTTRHALAWELGRLGRTADAITAYEQLLLDRERVLGPDNVDTRKTRRNLEYLRRVSNKTASE